MFPIKEVRYVYTPSGVKPKNICLHLHNNREMVYYADGYYYLSKDGKKMTTRRVKL